MRVSSSYRPRPRPSKPDVAARIGQQVEVAFLGHLDVPEVGRGDDRRRGDGDGARRGVAGHVLTSMGGTTMVHPAGRMRPQR